MTNLISSKLGFYNTNHNYNRILKYNWLSTVLISALIGQCTGLSSRAGGQGFSPATKRVAPGYFYWKIEPKEIPSRLIPRLLVVFTRQLEILNTTLSVIEHYAAFLSNWTVPAVTVIDKTNWT